MNLTLRDQKVSMQLMKRSRNDSSNANNNQDDRQKLLKLFAQISAIPFMDKIPAATLV